MRSSQAALEYLLKGSVAAGEQVQAEIKAKLSDEHVKVLFSTAMCCTALSCFVLLGKLRRIVHVRVGCLCAYC